MTINKPITIIIMVVIIFTVGVLFVVPAYEKSETLRRELIQRQAQYEARVDYYLDLTDTLGEIEDRKDALAKVNSALPNQFDMASIVFFLEQKAIESGLSMESVSFSQPAGSKKENTSDEQNSHVREVDFSVNIKGSYQGLKGFLAAIEHSSRLFNVSSIIFSDSNEQGVYNFDLGITTNTY